MTHPVLTTIVLLIFGSFIMEVVSNPINDGNVVIRFIGYAIAIILAIATLLIVLTQYIGIKF